jgi:hypothetical protein
MGLSRWACADEMKSEADLPTQLLAKVMGRDFDTLLGGM